LNNKANISTLQLCQNPQLEHSITTIFLWEEIPACEINPTMEEFQFFADPLSQGGPILGLNPGPSLPQPLDWHVDSVDPFYPEIDDRGFNCLPEPGMLNPYQDTAFTTLGCFGTAIGGLQPEVDAIPGYVDHPNLHHTSTIFFPGQDFAEFGHSYSLDIADFSMDGLGSSPTSEGLSPASQEMFPLSPLSSVAPLGSPQEPVYTDSSFSNTMIEVAMGLSPPFQQVGGVPSVRAPNLRRRREGHARQVPPLRTPRR